MCYTVVGIKNVEKKSRYCHHSGVVVGGGVVVVIVVA